MKKMCVSVLVLLLLALSLVGCERRSGGYTLIDVPKELEINVSALSEDTDNLMASGESAPLLAALPEEGLYLYAPDATVAQGVLVKYDGILQYFPWRFTPQLAQPDMFVADYNGDGKKDIAFTYVSSYGTTQRRENLHVLLRVGKGFKDNVYSCEKAASDASGKLAVGQGSDPDQFTAYLGDTQQTFTLAGHGEYQGLYFDDWQEFTLGETITVLLKPGLIFKDEGLPVYGALTYTATIAFEDGRLVQTDGQATTA